MIRSSKLNEPTRRSIAKPYRTATFHYLRTFLLVHVKFPILKLFFYFCTHFHPREKTFIREHGTNNKRGLQLDIFKGPITKLITSSMITFFKLLNNLTSVQKQVKSTLKNSLSETTWKTRTNFLLFFTTSRAVH